MNKNLSMSLKIAQAVRNEGGRAFYVGGYVRDKILGRFSKDIDIEIHGLSQQNLSEILSSLGQPVEMGASFGLLSLKHYSLDIVMPRSLLTGEIDPFVTEREAARRRDFTMNALMQDVLTGEILDFFGGIDDINAKVIRHVDDDTFLLDTLRVMRAARFSSSLGFVVDGATRAVCSSADLTSLAQERVFAEVENVITKSEMPSIFFEELERMKQLSFWFPEVQSVKNNIIDKAAVVRRKSVYPLGFMLASLCHDMAGTERFISRLTNDAKLNKYVINMAGLADTLEGMDEEALMRAFDRSECPEDLSLLSETLSGNSHSDTLALYRERMSRPFVTGADILAMGVSPGPLVGKILKHVHNLRLSGLPKSVQFEEVMKFIRGEEND